jgi:RNA polymerase sigma-32 factor
MKTSRPYSNDVENLSRYRSEMRKFPMFSTAVERTLCNRWRDHHAIPAAHQLVGKYLHLAVEIAEEYGGCGSSPEELIGEGYVGLMRAVCRFDPNRGVSFTAYANWRMREAIHEHVVRTMGADLHQIAILCTLQSEPDHLQEVDDATLRTVHRIANREATQHVGGRRKSAL